jgi:hypothetical protein
MLIVAIEVKFSSLDLWYDFITSDNFQLTMLQERLNHFSSSGFSERISIYVALGNTTWSEGRDLKSAAVKHVMPL